MLKKITVHFPNINTIFRNIPKSCLKFEIPKISNPKNSYQITKNRTKYELKSQIPFKIAKSLQNPKIVPEITKYLWIFSQGSKIPIILVLFE